MQAANSSKTSIYRLIFSWFFALVLGPALLLALLEGGLRLAGVGESTAPFIEKRVKAGTLHQQNPGFLEQFQSKPIGRTYWETNSFAVLSPKPANTLRIFIFGGSAVYGWPRQEYGVSRILQLLLMQRYPDKQIEVYNAAYPAMNSNVMRPMLKACLALDPDAFIICMGNNEYRGPFGLWDFAGRRRKPWTTPWIQLAISLEKLRTYQWFLQLGSKQPDETSLPPLMRPCSKMRKPSLRTISGIISKPCSQWRRPQKSL